MKGIITKVFPDKGFAFLRDTDGITRFIHASWTNGKFDTLQPGVQVDFIPTEGERGEQAKDVVVIIGGAV